MDGVPTNYVIDRAGILRYAKAAAFNLEALNDVLIPLLQESAPVSGPPPQDATAKTTPAQSPAS
jgi:hypothetical protein